MNKTICIFVYLSECQEYQMITVWQSGYKCQSRSVLVDSQQISAYKADRKSLKQQKCIMQEWARVDINNRFNQALNCSVAKYDAMFGNE